MSVPLPPRQYELLSSIHQAGTTENGHWPWATQIGHVASVDTWCALMTKQLVSVYRGTENNQPGGDPKSYRYALTIEGYEALGMSCIYTWEVAAELLLTESDINTLAGNLFQWEYAWPATLTLAQARKIREFRQTELARI